MSFPRASGILLHPTSLPGRFGIGDLGPEAYRFADFLASTRQRLWQVLPLGPLGYGYSPYQCFSAFAGNPLFISLEQLAEEKLLEPVDLDQLPPFPETRVNYEAVTEFKMPLFRKSFESFRKMASSHSLENFCEQNAYWLNDYALFMALKETHNLMPWYTWEEDIRGREPEMVSYWTQKLTQEIKYHKYLQYQFFNQWSKLKTYCHEHNIKIIGDVPIYVALDSADVWSHPGLFHLDASGRPTLLAGVPPDYFSKTGQLWGNPLYRWEVMAKDGYSWWLERLRAIRTLVDIIRLDHFIGFVRYWVIPAGEATAVNGRWLEGPGIRFFETVQAALGELPFIAEDLGLVTPEVEALRDQLGFPGLRVLQFAFGNGGNHKPYSYPRNCVVYTGTHDNNTTIGWFTSKDAGDTTRSTEEARREIRNALKYLGTDGREINWDFIRLALASVANTAIIPLQDILGLGSESRTNLPGTTEGNWEWRFKSELLTEEIKDRLGEMTAIYGRAARR